MHLIRFSIRTSDHEAKNLIESVASFFYYKDIKHRSRAVNVRCCGMAIVVGGSLQSSFLTTAAGQWKALLLTARHHHSITSKLVRSRIV